MINALRRHGQVPEDGPLVFTPIDCVRRGHRPAQEQVHVAFMYDREDGRRILAFYPGVTGHENYHVEDVRERLDTTQREFVPEDGMFGPTRWEHQPWFLCAGSDTWDSLEVSYGELREAIDILDARMARAHGSTEPHVVRTNPDA